MDKARRCTGAMELEEAIEAFMRGFAFVRSFTHPYVPQRVGLVWVVRDAPRKRADEYRREEWVAHGLPPAKADAIARRETRGRFCVTAIRAVGEDDAPIRSGYKKLGYRLHTTEPLMVHRLERIPRLAEPFPIKRVLTAELAERLRKAAGRREILPKHLVHDAPLRQYVAMDSDRLVGWVKSIAAGGAGGEGARDVRWVSNMHVVPRYRRRGVGRSLLTRMLRDDRAAGAAASVLTASHAGAMLYPLVGYEMLGELLVFTPAKR